MWVQGGCRGAGGSAIRSYEVLGGTVGRYRVLGGAGECYKVLGGTTGRWGGLVGRYRALGSAIRSYGALGVGAVFDGVGGTAVGLGGGLWVALGHGALL